MAKSSNYMMFERALEAIGIPEPTKEFKFHPTRRWRIDFAWPHHMLAVEVEGGVFVQGRHSRGAGMVKDMEKYNALTLRGWALLRFTPDQLITGPAIQTISTWFDSFISKEVPELPGK